MEQDHRDEFGGGGTKGKRGLNLRAGLAGGTAALLLALALASSSQPAASQASASLLVVVHATVAEQRLDDDALRAVFLRKRLLWPDGKRIIPLNYSAGHPLRVAFDRAVLGFNVDQSARYWIDARIRSGAQPPLSVDAEAMLVKVASQLPGTIGYISDRPIPAGLRAIARIEGGQVLAP